MNIPKNFGSLALSIVDESIEKYAISLNDGQRSELANLISSELCRALVLGKLGGYVFLGESLAKREDPVSKQIADECFKLAESLAPVLLGRSESSAKVMECGEPKR